MACLETTFLVDLLRGDKEVEKFKDELDKSEPVLSVAAPSVMELWTGACAGKLTKQGKEKIDELISSFVILSLDEKSAKRAGEIKSDLLKSGGIIEIEDIMIAGICLANGENIVTRDQHYAKISGLKVIKY